ncbi:DUF551 domain-containing protein [Salmonella enterica]|nr:DUF551 domain-containing protein [Salmonella enterica]EIC6911811.1 DUF551 domain-containing protein [Salmonella enterica subsp. enterica serovar Infantis]
MSEWNVRREIEPEEAGEYVCYALLDGIHMRAVYDWLPSRGHFSCETRRDKYITHWMPLPEPPTK